MKHIFPIILLVVIVYISSCANQGSPSGGPKDTIPPVFVNAIPPNKSLNYTSGEFQYEFNERISADQLRTKLNITPHTENKYKFFVKKNILTITFEGDFDDSTTYTFNFADGVGDITEKNPVENFTYAFSTGPIIDSIFVKGQVLDLYENKPIKKMLVGLFSIDDTLNIFSGKPRYFTKTDENGIFFIENIKAAYYKIYAFEDSDNNLENDPQKEPHGFISDSLNLLTSKDSVNIQVQLIDASPLKFVRSKNTGIYFDILYSKYMENYQLSKVDTTTTKSIPSNSFFKDNTIIRFYPDGKLKQETDSLHVRIECTDSLGNSTIDSLYVQFKQSKRKPESFQSTLQPRAQFAIKDILPIRLEFSKPIVQSNYDSINITYDSLKRIYVPDSIINWNTNRTIASFKLDVDPTYLPIQIKLLQEEHARQDSLIKNKIESGDSSMVKQAPVEQQIPKNQLIIQIKKGAFISIDNDTTELMERTYPFLKEENTGQISGSIITDETHYTLQLINDKYKVVDQISNPTNFLFTSILPGKYSFRVLIDKNKDGEWSAGNILKNLEPEPIWFYHEFTSMRANFYLEDITLSF